MGYHNGEPPVITPGVGVRVVVEIGWTKDSLRRSLGTGRKRVDRIRECVRFTERFSYYEALDMNVYLDRYGYVDDNKLKRIDWITFGPNSKVVVADRLRPKLSDRADVYALFGAVAPGPNAYYDSLGIGFGFKFRIHAPYQPTDTLMEIWIFPPKQAVIEE